jgi:staphylococcal nuclease domain-containing protein 1
VLHPAGNVAEHLLGNGLARIVEWHAGMLASHGGMERLRTAERGGKERRLNLFASLPVINSNGHGEGAAPSGQAKVFEATVVRVWSGDQVSVVGKDNGNERRLYLSSTRAPKYPFLQIHEC